MFPSRNKIIHVIGCFWKVFIELNIGNVKLFCILWILQKQRCIISCQYHNGFELHIFRYHWFYKATFSFFNMSYFQKTKKILFPSMTSLSNDIVLHTFKQLSIGKIRDTCYLRIVERKILFNSIFFFWIKVLFKLQQLK